MDHLDYYSRRDIQKAIVESSKDREVGTMFGPSKFGKRPDVLHFESDVLELIKQGATSFHISEEHWTDPLKLASGLNKKQLDELRKGWDLIIDIDSKELEHSKIIAHYIIEALKFHDIKNIFCKYSGNKGFHIAVPFNSFPDVINSIKTNLLFPDGPKIIASYLIQFVEPHLEKKLEELNIKIPIKDFLEVDTILISSRHMFRAPYSLHEKTGLVSLPINPNDVLKFKKELANPENIMGTIKFLDYEKIKEKEASKLLIQALDWDSKKRSRDIEEPKNKKVKYDEIKEKIPEKFFPPCMKLGLEGLADGKKRFLFMLINFLKSVGWSHEDVEIKVKEWNSKNSEPLKEGYILSQLSWHKRQKTKVLPQNCPHTSDNPSSNYYKSLGICQPDNLCTKIRNPVNYTIRKTRFKSSKK